MRDTTAAPERDAGSFRDPNGYVFLNEGRVFRAIMPAMHQQFATIYDSGIISRLAKQGFMIACERVDADEFTLANYTGARGETAAALYEHPKVPMVSYPYEWTFSQLKAAALAHLDLQIAAFEEGYVLSDATAYNMQFVEGRPIHIDVLSIQQYEEGKPWNGYNQFCRQFLLPLLLEAWGGVSYQAMYRGSIDGIPFADALSILPKHRLFSSLTGFLHVYLHGRSITSASSAKFNDKTRKAAAVSKSNYLAILKQLHGFLTDLQSKKRSETYWNSYASKNSYSDDMRDTKLHFVRDWAAQVKPNLIWDIGGNTGDFSMAAIEAGAKSSIVLDSDLDSLEALFNTRTQRGAPILPLAMNLSDPSSDIGWRQSERKGLMSRANADGVIALAVIHHLVIGANLPFDEVVNWFLDLAPEGIIEFVPKRDPMVRQLLEMRPDMFPDYTEERFRELVSMRKKIVSEHVFDSNGRLLVSYSDH
ncbi:hypothetical protein [uncultured Roseovarius sp.]|uniref:hypothetical protein n=1 Tax=uncultured Roseovarius sp. TaxID=293344 RepID=UPI00262B1301|nr:hypothetical protein [uncultured Roseovarius sp.]